MSYTGLQTARVFAKYIVSYSVSVAAKFDENFMHDLDFFLDYQHVDIDGGLSFIQC